MRERNFIIAYLVFIVLALLYSDYSKNKILNKQKEDWGAYIEFIQSLPYAKELIIND